MLNFVEHGKRETVFVVGALPSPGSHRPRPWKDRTNAKDGLTRARHARLILSKMIDHK